MWPAAGRAEGRRAVSFEQVFGDVERAADAAIASGQGLVSLAKKLQKAAREGNVAAVKRAQGDFDAALREVRQAAAGAVASWPLPDDDEQRYLEDGYAAELCAAAEERGLSVYERDGKLISYPSIVRILPGDRAVRVDGKRVAGIRPSHLAGLLLKNQKKPARHRSDRFLEALYTVYAEVVREDAGGRAAGDGPVVPLTRVYKLLTSLPGAAREYDRTDFARDLFILEAEGPRRTRKGAAVSFPASTGTRRAGLFTFVGPDGQEARYYGISFTADG